VLKNLSINPLFLSLLLTSVSNSLTVFINSIHPAFHRRVWFLHDHTKTLKAVEHGSVTITVTFGLGTKVAINYKASKLHPIYEMIKQTPL